MRPLLRQNFALSAHARSPHGSDQAPPDQYTDPVAIAGLIVTAADLAWTIYRDLRANHTTSPTPEHLTRRVRTTLRETRTLDSNAEQVIEITVEETLKALPPTD